MTTSLRTPTSLFALLLACAPFHAAHADLGDDQPWNREDQDLISGAVGNASSESLTQELRETHKHPGLKLSIDLRPGTRTSRPS